MIRGFTGADSPVLFGLLADCASDILIRTDAQGFIIEASPGLESIGIEPSGMLFAPHVMDLAVKGHAQRLRNYWCDALAGIAFAERVEFPLERSSASGLAESWFALTIRPTLDDAGAISGSIGILRAIDHRRAIEDELLAAAMSDPLTGLGNRHAFQSYLSRHLADDLRGAVILFGIDRFRAIVMRYGQSKGDEVLWAFAQFLRTMLGQESTITRTEGERFGVILPGVSTPAAQAIADETIRTFSELVRESGRRDFPLSVSAGLTELAGHHDAVLANAELALTLAHAAGGQRAEFRADGAPDWHQRKRA